MLQLLKSEALSLQLFECVPAPTLFVIISRLTISSRPSNPLNAFLLAPQIRLLLTSGCVYKLYLLTYLLRYGDGAGNTAEENSSVFSLIRIR